MASIVKLEQANEHLRNRLTAIRRNAKAEGQQLLRTGVGVVTGYGLGMATQKWGEDSVGGMSPALATGAVATAAALFELGGADVAPYLRAIGDAGLIVAAFSKGMEHQAAREREGG